MLASQMIVGLWFVPVVLFIIIPLSILCLWLVHKLMRKIVDRIEQTHRSVKQSRNQSRTPGIQPRHAV